MAVGPLRRRDVCPSKNELLVKKYIGKWNQRLSRVLREDDENLILWTNDVKWQLVTDDVLVFSAYLTNTTVWGVHVIGLVRIRATTGDSFTGTKFRCLIRTGDGRVIRKKAHLRPLTERSANKFQPIIIICPLRKGDGTVFSSVSLASKGSKGIVWRAIDVPPSAAPTKCCSVCVKPAYGESPGLWEFIEFMAHHTLLGSGSVFLYDANMSRDLISLVGRMQVARWNVTILPFKLPSPWNGSVDHQGWGQAAALADCAFRSRFKTEYFIHLDFKELMIVGHYNGTLPTFIDRVEAELGRKNVGSLLVGKRRFCYEYDLDVAYLLGRGLPFRSMLVRRHSGDLGFEGRTGLVARSSAVCAVGDRFVEQHCGFAKERRANPLALRIHRYGSCCDLTSEEAEKTRGMDNMNPEGTQVAFLPKKFIKKYTKRLNALLKTIKVQRAPKPSFL